MVQIIRPSTPSLPRALEFQLLSRILQFCHVIQETLRSRPPPTTCVSTLNSALNFKFFSPTSPRALFSPTSKLYVFPWSQTLRKLSSSPNPNPEPSQKPLPIFFHMNSPTSGHHPSPHIAFHTFFWSPHLPLRLNLRAAPEIKGLHFTDSGIHCISGGRA